jgi:hypothetical protein
MTSTYLERDRRTEEHVRVEAVIRSVDAAGNWPVTTADNVFDEIERQQDIYKAALAIHEASTKALAVLAERSREHARYVTCDQEWWAVEIDGSHEDTFSSTFGCLPKAIERARREAGR